MASAKIISDQEGLASWLKKRPTQEAIAIATCATLRVLPLYVAAKSPDWFHKHDFAGLSILRSVLTSGVARKDISPEVKYAVANVSDARNNSLAVDRAVPYTSKPSVREAADIAAAYASFSARAPASRVNATASVVSAARAARAVDANVGAPSIWDQVENDRLELLAGKDLSTVPLWFGVPPKWFRLANAEMREFWQTNTPEHWSFWQRWWDATLAGTPLNLGVQRDIALIDDKVWKAGPKSVAEEIAKIEKRYEPKPLLQDFIVQLETLVVQNPYAWRISFNAKAQVFEASAIVPRDLAEIVVSVRDAIKQFHTRCKAFGVSDFGHSVQLAFDPVIKLLRSDLRRYANSPFSLLKCIEAGRAEMEDISKKEGFAGESYLTRFFLELQSAGEDICVASPEVVVQLKEKMAVRYQLHTLERKQITMYQAYGLEMNAEGILKRVAHEALRHISDDTATVEQKQQAWQFATSVLPRVALSYVAEMTEAESGLAQLSDAPSKGTIIEVAEALGKLKDGGEALAYAAPTVANLIAAIINNL
jgi:hypothetical protein